MWRFVITLIIVSLTMLQTLTVAVEVRNVQMENSKLTNETKRDVNFMPTTTTGIDNVSMTDSPQAVIATPKDNLKQTSPSQEIVLISDYPSTVASTPPPSRPSPPITSSPLVEGDEEDNNNNLTTTHMTSSPSPALTAVTATPDPYCTPSLCELYNGTHFHLLPHTACHNPGHFAPTCGPQPHLLHMSERRRNLILALHNLARSRIASGQVAGYGPASHMPQIKWDTELEHLATLHVKRCSFNHDQCRNTPRFPYSGQNIGYYWIRREIKSHSRRMKNFIVNWYKEYLDADQSYVDSYHMHPEGKKIGHFTQMVADRVHRVGCAAIRYHEPDQPDDTKFLMTCNYDYTNIFGEPIYQSGPTASKCVYNTSDKYPALCDWKEANYEYENENNDGDEAYTLENDIRN